VKRRNKPDLSGRFIWASSHSNFLCDTMPSGFEGPAPTKYLAKSTLFQFPIKGFLEFCGCLPLTRVEDAKNISREARSQQNRATFRLAIQAIFEGWPLAIFPEGTSIVAPGLVLPLKSGVAKLGFAAEEAHDFSLGLKAIPVGLEYGSRTKFASGLTIHYGRPLAYADYKTLHDEDREAAVKKFLDDFTAELIRNFPHFRDERTQSLGNKLVALGLCKSKFEAAQLFLLRENDTDFWNGLKARLRTFEEATKDNRIPVPAWGHRVRWKELGGWRRNIRRLFMLVAAPIALVDLINSSFAEFCLRTLVGYVAVDQTEEMTIRLIASLALVPLVCALQFWLIRHFIWGAGAGYPHPFLLYLGYMFSTCAVWYTGIHWRRQFKRLSSLYLFKLAGVDARSASVSHYRALRQYLGEF
jgi:1-acyl-sn-glycerol-3-phosphate acyltransferase